MAQRPFDVESGTCAVSTQVRRQLIEGQRVRVCTPRGIPLRNQINEGLAFLAVTRLLLLFVLEQKEGAIYCPTLMQS